MSICVHTHIPTALILDRSRVARHMCLLIRYNIICYGLSVLVITPVIYVAVPNACSYVKLCVARSCYAIFTSCYPWAQETILIASERPSHLPAV